MAGGAERVGWKIGLNIPEVQARLGLTEPVVGHLTSATRLEPGASYSHDDARDLRAEAEVAIQVAEGGAISGYGAAIELVDVGRPPSTGIEEIVARNVFHRAFVLGPVHRERPMGEAQLLVGREVRDVAPLAGDFEASVAHVARHLAAVGERLEPGDVVIAGALAHVPVNQGDEIAVAIGALGRLEVTIRP